MGREGESEGWRNRRGGAMGRNSGGEGVRWRVMRIMGIHVV